MVAELDHKIVHRQYLDPKVHHQTINNQSAETHHQISNKHEAMSVSDENVHSSAAVVITDATAIVLPAQVQMQTVNH